MAADTAEPESEGSKTQDFALQWAYALSLPIRTGFNSSTVQFHTLEGFHFLT